MRSAASGYSTRNSARTCASTTPIRTCTRPSPSRATSSRTWRHGNGSSSSLRPGVSRWIRIRNRISASRSSTCSGTRTSTTPSWARCAAARACSASRPPADRPRPVARRRSRAAPAAGGGRPPPGAIADRWQRRPWRRGPLAHELGQPSLEQEPPSLTRSAMARATDSAAPGPSGLLAVSAVDRYRCECLRQRLALRRQ